MMILMGVLAGVLGLWLFAFALKKPRLLTYAIFALAPTQFIFIPVSTFFISPADVLVLGGAAAFLVRLAAGDRQSMTSVWHHRYLFLMLAVYLLGFVVLGVFSRTLIRVPMAFVPSLLACEVFRERVHLRRAATALVIAGGVDAAYGLYFYAIGAPIHPTRFSGLSGVNFSATVIITSAMVLFAKRAATRKWTALASPGALLSLGAATFSQAGLLACVASWILVLRRAMTRRNALRITAVALLLVAAGLSSGRVRETIASRNRRTLEIDGVERNSADVRRMLMGVAWQGFNESPFVGLGYAQFAAYSTIDRDVYNSTAGEGYGTHNTYLEIVVEGGLLGFAFFALHFVRYLPRLRIAMKHVAARKDPVTASALVGLPLVLVAAGLSNLLLHYHFWSVCGLALACLARSQLVFGASRPLSPSPAIVLRSRATEPAR